MQKMDDLAEMAMAAYTQQGQHDKAVEACSNIR